MPLVVSSRFSLRTQMKVGIGVCIGAVGLAIFMLALHKYLMACFELIPAYYGALIAEVARRKLRSDR
jgi:hypothetical protein